MATVVEQSAYEKERNKPMPSKNHAIVQTNLIVELSKVFQGERRLLTEINIALPGGERIPDLAIYNALDFTPGQDEVRVQEVPKTIIEILSPKQNLSELISKASEYFAAGIQSYWLVLPDLCSIYVFKAPNDYEVFVKDQTLKDPSLSLELALTSIFS